MSGLLLAAGLALAACSAPLRPPSATSAVPVPPYPYSRYVAGVTWDFSPLLSQRSAHGSDLWPCAWATDGNLYCAWGDGGGFDGNDDTIGRVSLGFARIEGIPSLADPGSWKGKNLWGAPPYAEGAATFGGKVSSMISVGGVLYGAGSLWTAASAAKPTSAGEQGPLKTLVWSFDLGKTWHIAPWHMSSSLGSFLAPGRDDDTAFNQHVYVYYLREGDSRHIYLKRVARDRLRSDPATPGLYQYLSHAGRAGRRVAWSARESDAAAVFFDPNHVMSQEVSYDPGLSRYLMTVGHYASGDPREASAGQFGLFESPNPWGPWSTIGYYENWGNLRAETTGDYLELHIPPKWMSADGAAFWGVFSGLHAFDAFNLVKATLTLTGTRAR